MTTQTKTTIELYPELVAYYNEHAEARGDLRPIGPRSTLSYQALMRKVARVEKEAESWTDM